MLLYAVTDRTWIGARTLREQVAEAIEGGVTCVQLREKEMDDEALFREALSLRELCHARGVPFIVNDNLAVATRCGADGIHVGQEDMNAKDVRARVGDEMSLGVSVKDVEEALRAVHDGADYLGVGAVFPTSTKSDATLVTIETLRDICSAVKVPVVAIGGIREDNIRRLAGSGVDGVAVVSAIFGAPDIADACRRLRALSERMVRS